MLNKLREFRALNAFAKRQSVGMQRKLMLYWVSMILVVFAAVILLLSIAGAFSQNDVQLHEVMELHMNNTRDSLTSHLDRLTAPSLKLSRELSRELEAALAQREGSVFWARFWKSAGVRAEDKVSQASREHSQQKYELEQSRARFDALIKSGYASAANLRGAKARLAEAREEYESSKEHYSELLEEQKKSIEGNKKAREEVEKARRAVEAVGKKWDAYNERMEKTRREREEWNKEKARLDAELQKSRAKLGFLGRDLLELRNKKEQAPDGRKELDFQAKLLEAEREKLNGEQSALVKEHSELYALCQTLAELIAARGGDAS